MDYSQRTKASYEWKGTRTNTDRKAGVPTLLKRPGQGHREAARERGQRHTTVLRVAPGEKQARCIGSVCLSSLRDCLGDRRQDVCSSRQRQVRIRWIEPPSHMLSLARHRGCAGGAVPFARHRGGRRARPGSSSDCAWRPCASRCSGEVTVEICESLPTATLLNQNTDTYNDYLGEFGTWNSNVTCAS